MEMLDEIRVVRNPLTPVEQQLEEIEFVAASIAFADAQDSDEDATELEVDLLNRFMKGETSPLMRRAWAAFRRRLLHHHGRES